MRGQIFASLVDAVIAYLEPRMKGEFIYRLPTGFVLGAVIGSAIVLTERLSGKIVVS
jgi:hypothetical protein